MGQRPKHSVSLITGDPAKEPASFTRFILPFVPSSRAGDRAPSPFADYDIPNLRERRTYFTPETSDVLFSRAHWLQSSEGEQCVTLHIGDKPVNARLAAPRVVLFEADTFADPHPILSTGFLLLDMSFAAETAVTLDDLLVINEMFRYWRSPFDDHLTKVRTTPDGQRVAYGDFIRDAAADGDPYTYRWTARLMPNGRGLISPEANEAASQWLQTGHGEPGWIAYTDERAFVWTCALTERGSAGMTERSDWVRFLNVDLPGTGRPTEFESQWIRSRTYERWQHCGTLYGFNAHSGAMLGERCFEPPTWRHFSELYFDQMLLLLYLRVCTFRFSLELSRVSENLLAPHHHSRGFEDFRRLRRSFAFLTNLYRFPLLSSQQQGIEMYDCARKALDVDTLFEEVKEEIESTHEFFEMATAEKTATTTKILTQIAAIAAVIGVTAAFVGTNWEPVLTFLSNVPYVPPPLTLGVLFVLLGVLLFKGLEWNERRRMR